MKISSLSLFEVFVPRGLYHNSFPLVCVYGLTSAVIHMASVVMMIAMFATGATTGGLWLWITLAVYIIVQTI